MCFDWLARGRLDDKKAPSEIEVRRGHPNRLELELAGATTGVVDKLQTLPWLTVRSYHDGRASCKAALNVSAMFDLVLVVQADEDVE